MAAFWWTLLIIAGGILLYTLLKPRFSFGWLLRFITNLALAAGIVYFIQATGLAGDVQLSLNIPSILIAGFLGLPGIALLYGIQLLVFA